MQPVIVAGVPITGLPPCGVAVQQPKPLTVTSKERAAAPAAPASQLHSSSPASVQLTGPPALTLPPSELAIALGVTPMNGVGRITKMAATTSRTTKVAT